MPFRSRTLSILVLTFLLASLFAGCLPQSNGSQKTLTIAVVEDNPGTEQNANSQSIYAGVKLAASQVNAANRNIRVVVELYDDGNDPVQAAQQASKVVDGKAVAVIGHSSIETGLAASDLYNEAGLAVLNVVPVTEELITQHGSQLSVTYTVEAEAAYLTNYLMRIDEKFSAGIIHTDAADSEQHQKDFRNMLAGLGGVVTFREKVELPQVTPVEGQVGAAETSAATSADGQGQAGATVEAQLKQIVGRMAEIPVGERPTILFVAADADFIAQLKEVMDQNQISIQVKGLEILEGTELADLVGKRQASIVYTNDKYGLALGKQFRNSFRGLGGEIVVDEPVLNDQFEDIFSKLISKGNDVPLFLAMDEKTAADFFVQMKRKGIAAPVIGPSSLSSKVFRDVLAGQDEEKVLSGSFTNGTLTTRALIFDSANRYAGQFLADYQAVYKQEEPGDKVVNGYDAVMALVTAAQRGGLGQTTADSRALLLKSLLQMDDSDASAQGLASPIFFEPSRLSSRVARFGVYQSGNVVSANVQFEPVFNPNEIKDLQDQVRRGRILTVNGRYVYKANVVYSGIDLLSIDEIDIKNSTYKMDFYLWFRYRPNKRDAEFKPDEFVFTNAEGDVELVPVREETNSDGTVLKTYRVSGTFKNQFRFQAYPFEHQNLIVEFRNQNATTSFIQYVVDRTGMRNQNDESDLLGNYEKNGAFDSIFGWKPVSVRVAQDIFPTLSTFGSPQNFGRNVATNYSLINVNVDIQRDSLQYIVKSLLPLLITLILAYITFFLPLGHSERLAVGSTALLTTAFFHLQLADALPEIGYTVAMEYLFYASYIMSALMVLLETLSVRYEKSGEDSKKKDIKALYEAKRERLNTLGRIVYPSVFGVVVFAGVLVYFGVLSLDARTTEAQRLAEVAAASAPETATSSAGTNSNTNSDAPAGQIKLVLNTWRPEDSAQIEALLAEFHKYAESQGQDIVIEHKPVVSINYDSILDQQLARGKDEPDLFYVRSYSVDGSIAKYLQPLTADTVDVKANYDETRIVPWMNRNKEILAVPYVGVVQGIYYNAEQFRALRLEPPQTWNAFLAALKQIKAGGLIPIANALNDREDSEMFMSMAANFLGGPEGRAKLMQTDGNSQCYNSARVVNSFQAVENLKPYLPPDAAEITSQRSKELFFDGKAVMLFGGSWDLQTVTEKADFDWSVMPVPGITTKSTYVIFQPDVGIGINRDSPNKEAAQLFLNWLMSKDAVDLTADKLPGFYPLNKLGTNDTTNTNSRKFLDLLENPTDIRWMFTEISNEYPRADAIIRSNLHAMLTGGLTPTEAAQNLQSGLGEWYEPAQSCRP